MELASVKFHHKLKTRMQIVSRGTRNTKFIHAAFAPVYFVDFTVFEMKNRDDNPNE